MLSEEKIKKMIRLSDYENGQGSTDLRRTKYRKTDYVRLQIIKTFLSVILSVILILALIVMYHLEYVLRNALMLPYRAYIAYGGAVFLLIELLAIIVTCRVSARQYDESKIRVKEYYVTLHDLLELYEKEEQGQEEGAL